ncbi:MAG: FeoB-associated Cys-rich membrane protein [Clostridia bacterium]|nr:FeoB-associated Cys-rich membrane protein [Clostridia bacterium]
MTMDNLIIIIVLIVIVGSAGYYIWKEKKNGKKCIGCPMSGCGPCKECSDKLQKDEKNS